MVIPERGERGGWTASEVLLAAASILKSDDPGEEEEGDEGTVLSFILSFDDTERPHLFVRRIPPGGRGGFREEEWLMGDRGVFLRTSRDRLIGRIGGTSHLCEGAD